MRYALIGLVLPVSALAEPDIYFLGEQHDNPAHHTRQAELVAQYQPKALVFEMLTQAQAARVTPELIMDETALEAALGWNDSGWPDFSMYYPIFAAAPEAKIHGAALPRSEARRIMSEPITAVFGSEAGAFGLEQPLPTAQQEAREALQMAAHCDALPETMLPMMVDIQRLRDASLAREALEALEAHGAPVVVITGNGHARTDWGAPAFVAHVAPEIAIEALGQGEDGLPPSGAFDTIAHSPAIERGDPCDAFK